MAENSDAFAAQVRDWSCHHFSITESDGETSRLLRKVADAIDQLGNANILDITYSPAADPGFEQVSATVYLTFESS